MMAPIGMMRALYPGETVSTPRRRRAKKYRIVRQDRADNRVVTPFWVARALAGFAAD